MLKRLTVAVAALFVLATSAFGAGTIPYSLSQQLDEFGKPLSGCKLYTYQAGTVATPQNNYQDSSLTLVNPNPLTCDSAGRLPQFFLADGSIKVRLTKSNGTVVVVADGILVVGASSGGGGGSPVDATTIFQTGDTKLRYGTGVHTGWVRQNGRTIGSATSGATERANADCQALFQYLWDTDANLSVSGGRGASSAADWAANKTITLPDARGRGIAGLDDMGNSAAGRLSGSIVPNGTTLGGVGGAESVVLAANNIPTLNSSGSNSITVASPAAIMTVAPNQSVRVDAAGGFGYTSIPALNAVSSSGNNTISVAYTNGSPTAINKVQPTILMSIYQKL